MADFTKTYDIVDSPGSQTAKQAILYNEANLDDLISDYNTNTNKTITTPTINVSSDANGDMYYRAAGVFARLAKGAADLKLFMNAAATAPEWANGMKIGTETYDTATASGDQVISGVGFKPSNIILIASVSGTSQMSVGLDNGTNHYCLVDYHVVGADQWSASTSYSVLLYQTAAITSIGSVTTLGADGFTISWVKSGAKVGNAVLLYIAFR